jgi:hypothetical protein
MEARVGEGAGLGEGVRDYSLPFLSAFDPELTFVPKNFGLLHLLPTQPAIP